jgi:hypothetical protein
LNLSESALFPESAVAAGLVPVPVVVAEVVDDCEVVEEALVVERLTVELCRHN